VNVWKVEIRGRVPAMSVEYMLVFAEKEEDIREKLNISEPSIRTDVELLTPDKPHYLGYIEYDGSITPLERSPSYCEKCGEARGNCECS
jgi:hypothetical protein